MDGVRCGLRDDTGAGLRPGQGGLGFQISPDQRFIAEYRAHFSGAEHVAKQCRIEHSAGQGQPPVLSFQIKMDKHRDEQQEGNCASRRACSRQGARSDRGARIGIGLSNTVSILRLSCILYPVHADSRLHEFVEPTYTLRG
jgi:hypothetical protein